MTSATACLKVCSAIWIASASVANSINLRSGRTHEVLHRSAQVPAQGPSPAPAAVDDDVWPMADERQPFPDAQFRQPASDHSWPRARSKWRKSMRASTESLARGLDAIDGDNGPPDTYLWRNRSEFAPKGNASMFWTELCKGANESLHRQGNASEAGRPLDDWAVQNNTQCAVSERFGMEHTNEEEALEECGGRCGAVIDVGCNRSSFRLCSVGAAPGPAVNMSDCLRTRPANYVPASAQPRGPQDLEFWDRFCNEAPSVPFHVVFPGRLCLAGKVLGDDVPTDGACAELTAADAECSDVFDYVEGPPAVCRCALTHGDCDPEEVEDGAEGDVYTLERAS